MINKDHSEDYWKKYDQKIGLRHLNALKYIEKGPVLDVGCGDGLLMQMIIAKGLYVKGIDYSAVAVHKAKNKGLNAIRGDGASMPFKNNSFSTVVATDVLEHSFTPDRILSEMLRIARDRIIFIVPNFNSFCARMQVMFGFTPEQNKAKKGHVYWFNIHEIKALLTSAGIQKYRIIAQKYFSSHKTLGHIGGFFCMLFPRAFSISFTIIIDTRTTAGNKYERIK